MEGTSCATTVRDGGRRRPYKGLGQSDWHLGRLCNILEWWFCAFFLPRVIDKVLHSHYHVEQVTLVANLKINSSV